jgi:hypothetical protein
MLRRMQVSNYPGITLHVLFLCSVMYTWQYFWLSLQNFTIDWRLGDGTTTGKIAARNAVTNLLQSYVIYNQSELYTPIFGTPYGTTPAGSGALTATVSTLQVWFSTLILEKASAEDFHPRCLI